ncbi:Ankyrin repeat-containing protein P1E11.10 [Taphrina deformans PYCC 5710]|uniref:Ankyrin repeat-containing protein P1E11.10 n=1 Tax=Taphrina deformans (strain PYCC 5710 / ATCC 11124 / CBS 356.35 / IMI 108563 / JCM 9778 / NBRC 8474) TaxID=1097556 RepID=R4X7T7_TAPDE|nr:Ankyrin repeat-containing protein P1E11.10 [Taphrina deformans PYCC 5710]|eukprot:CCG81258.1 Ankyrin repeat-containing protein P1E11.10 [Taphrina deformans PYCC 5710]
MPSVALRQNTHANIFLAASDNDIPSVTQFLDSGVDVNALDSNGYSTLHAASSYNHFELLRFLVSRGGNVNLPDHDGDTPLYVAESREMCALLVQLGADPTHKNGAGQTALDHAIDEDEFPDVVAYLSSQSLGEGQRDFGNVNVRYETMDEPSDGANAQTQGQSGDETADMLGGLPQETRDKIWQVIGNTAQDGVNRDEELRSILSEALIGQGVLDESASRQKTQ